MKMLICAHIVLLLQMLESHFFKRFIYFYLICVLPACISLHYVCVCMCPVDSPELKLEDAVNCCGRAGN